MHQQEFPVTSEDTTNGVEYELDYPTFEYSFYLLMMVKDAMTQQQGYNNRIPTMRLRRPFDRYFNSDSDTSLDTILPQLIGELSLKIKNTNTNPKTLNKFSSFKTAFIFEFMYKTGNSLVEFLDIVDMFPMDNVMRDRFDTVQIDAPPLRKYSDDIVDYYKQTLASMTLILSLFRSIMSWSIFMMKYSNENWSLT